MVRPAQDSRERSLARKSAATPLFCHVFLGLSLNKAFVVSALNAKRRASLSTGQAVQYRYDLVRYHRDQAAGNRHTDAASGSERLCDKRGP